MVLKKLAKLVFDWHNVFALIISVSLVVYSLNVANPNNTPQIIYIESADDGRTILETLQKKGIIKNRITYNLAYLLTRFSNQPEPGAYYFKNGMSALAISNKLQDPEYKYVYIQEGWRKEQIASAYARILDWNEEQKEAMGATPPLCLFLGREGYLYPGSYLVPTKASGQSILAKMENNFYENFSQIDKKDNFYDEDQIIKIASLIQREAAGQSDMRLISGIIWNRIYLDMPLQVDATLQYIKGEDGDWWPTPKSEDKFLDSPYNSYQNKGLPPAPIANPGKAAIEAALNPIQTTCLFYLHDKNRNIHCASTYESHLNNIKRYL